MTVLRTAGTLALCDAESSDEADRVAELAACPNVWSKVSGLVTEARWHDWRSDDLAPVVDHVHRMFGGDRLMFGSDWPVCLLAAEGYDAVKAAAHACFDGLTAVRRDEVFSGVPRRAYRLEGGGDRC